MLDIGVSAAVAEEQGGVLGPEEAPGLLNAHLLLVRDALIADRFEIAIRNATVTSEDGFSAEVGIRDEQTGNMVTDGNPVSTASGETLGNLDIGLEAFFAWMEDSPDYNHSTQDRRQPGAPTQSVPVVTDGKSPTDGYYPVSLRWDQVDGVQWGDLDTGNTVGTVGVHGAVPGLGNNTQITGEGTIHIQGAAEDFAFDGEGLDEGEGRREVVQFDTPQDGGSGVQSCRSCHMQLAMHGTHRVLGGNAELCVTCHNPNMTDVAHTARLDTDLPQFGPNAPTLREQRNMLKTTGSDGKFEESEDFKRLIHAIHASGRDRSDGSGMEDGRMHPITARDETFDETNFPGVLSNCAGCHKGSAEKGWTIRLNDLPEGMIGSSALTGDWFGNAFVLKGGRIHDLSTHRKMTPIASVCTSCHDGGLARHVPNEAPGSDGVLGWHIWEQGGVAPRIAPNGESTTDLNMSNEGQVDWLNRDAVEEGEPTED